MSTRTVGLFVLAFAIVGVGTASTSAAPAQPATPAVFAWGNNQNSTFGNGDTTSSNEPVEVTPSGTLTGKRILSISAGSAHACAVTDDGGASCWGDNASGQLGNGTNTSSPVPVAVSLNGKTVTQISAGSSSSCAVTTEATNNVYCWGHNSSGQLGGGSNTDSLVPVAVNAAGGPMANKKVTQVVVRTYHACAVTTEATNNVYCWGNDTWGQLGGGSNTDSSVPVAVNAAGVLRGKRVVHVSIGHIFSCAITDDGGTYCWGDNTYGQLGNNNIGTRSPIPVAVDTTGALQGKKAVELSASFDGNHSCVVTDDGGAYCWGDNTFGQISNGTANSSPVPVAVHSAGALVGTFVTRISAGLYHTCALTLAGDAYCWGRNRHGELGNSSNVGSNVRSNTPVAVTTGGQLSGKKLSQITTGVYYTLALAAPAPTVTSVSPTSGPAEGGTTVTIIGTGFLSGATVTVDGATCSNTTVTATTITCTTPAHAAGAVDVIVTNPDNQTATSADAFTFLAAPTVPTVAPATPTTPTTAPAVAQAEPTTTSAAPTVASAAPTVDPVTAARATTAGATTMPATGSTPSTPFIVAFVLTTIGTLLRTRRRRHT